MVALVDKNLTAAPDDSALADARSGGLRYTSDSRPGLRRVKRGGGFQYVEPGGGVIRDAGTLRRIRSLAIPPAWRDVWICVDTRGHLQATGRDARGRKQYRYHPRWREVRDATKYDRMVRFAHALPRIRQRVSSDLAERGLVRVRVLAAVVRLLDMTLLRVGNEEYAQENKSYGLTTLRSRHVDVDGDVITLDFRGKSGKRHVVEVTDRRVAAIIRRCQDLPGEHLFQYVDAEGQTRSVESGDVNDYLREISGEDFTAKDFRTWAGTVTVACALNDCGPFMSQAVAKRDVVRAIELAARELGNTPAVCRRCYVHPHVLEAHLDSRRPLLSILSRKQAPTALRPEEKAVLRLLESQSKPAAQSRASRAS